MDAINGLFNWLAKALTWWVTVMPWEQGLRIRFGNRIKLLKPGIYIKVPIIDGVYVQTTRLRIIALPIQTVSTLDAKTITVAATGGYAISDIQKLYNNLYHPEITISSFIMGLIADYVAAHNLIDCSPERIAKEVNKELIKYSSYGLTDVSAKIIGYAVVRTYRLISDQHYMDRGMQLDVQSDKRF